MMRERSTNTPRVATCRAAGSDSDGQRYIHLGAGDVLRRRGHRATLAAVGVGHVMNGVDAALEREDRDDDNQRQGQSATRRARAGQSEGDEQRDEGPRGNRRGGRRRPGKTRRLLGRDRQERRRRQPLHHVGPHAPVCFGGRREHRPQKRDHHQREHEPPASPHAGRHCLTAPARGTGGAVRVRPPTLLGWADAAARLRLRSRPHAGGLASGPPRGGARDGGAHPRARRARPGARAAVVGRRAARPRAAGGAAARSSRCSPSRSRTSAARWRQPSSCRMRWRRWSR